MFDKLIESEPAGAEFKTRRSYFMVSSLVVGVLFITAVVVSIYASEIGLGNNSFELVEMLAPDEVATPEPDTPQPRQQRAQATSQLPSRQVNMLRPDESPREIPNEISTSQNTVKARPLGDFDIRKFDSDPLGETTTNRSTVGPVSGGPSLSRIEPVAVIDKEPEAPPPAVKKVQPQRQVSGGVMNGKAIDLPKPIYSAAAKSIGAQGQVQVQVLIDETGRVISANATGGHPMLISAAVDAAKKARFTPTFLTGVPVKVTGVIVYNFTR